MSLIDIQKMQFSDKHGAEALMLAFLKEHEDQAITKVELTPKPESLNSINGFISYDNGERLFFKTHVEENEQLSEYYNAGTLANAGYPVVSAKQIRHRPGKQIVLYEIISLATLFDLIKKEEDEQIKGQASSKLAEQLLEAQIALDKTVFDIYRKTLQIIPETQHIIAPIHQLFSHRLADEGRLGIFYRGKKLILPEKELSFEELASMRWRINGVLYSDSIEEIVQRSRELLSPAKGINQSPSLTDCPSVIGHGDAHNGNIFVKLDPVSLHMFDPAFAGRHNPILDLTKPLFHNVFARWMYYPEQVKKEFEISWKINGNEISIEHTFFPSSMRLEHMESRKDNLLKPCLRFLKERRQLPPLWSEYLHSALFCCPFLTVNLFAPYLANGTLSERYELPIKLLGLCMAVELGSLSHDGENKFSKVTADIFCL